MKQIIIKFVGKDKLGDAFGRAYNDTNIILIRDDLSKWIKFAVIVHELYHLHDSRKNVLLREVKAITAQFFISFFGSIGTVFKSLSLSRLKFYYNRIKNKE